MALSDTETELGKIITHFAADMTAIATSITNATAVGNDLTELTANQKARVQQQYAGYRQLQSSLISRARDASMPYLAKMAGYIGSPHHSRGRITNMKLFHRDLLAYYVANTKYVAARAVTYGNNPSDSASGLFRRLTVDKHGEKIENGRHNQTVRARIKNTEAGGGGTGKWNAEIFGAGLADDYLVLSEQAGAGRILMPNAGPENTGTLVNKNGEMSGNATVTDLADITAIDDWDITNTGSPTFQVDTGNKWRGQSYGLNVSGASTGVTLEQTIENLRNDDGEIPIGIMCPVLMDGANWAGDITIGIGDQTTAFTESDLTDATWVPLFKEFDKELFGLSWEETDATFLLDVQTDAAITDKVVLGGYYAIYGRTLEATRNGIYTGPWYFYWANEADAVNETAIAWSADSMTAAGAIARFFAVVWNIYLRSTASGTEWTL